MFSTSASNTPLLTVKFTNEFPFRLTVTSEAPIKVTFPFTTFIVPSFETLLAISEAKPESEISIVPRFITDCVESPLKV